MTAAGSAVGAVSVGVSATVGAGDASVAGLEAVSIGLPTAVVAAATGVAVFSVTAASEGCGGSTSIAVETSPASSSLVSAAVAAAAAAASVGGAAAEGLLCRGNLPGAPMMNSSVLLSRTVTTSLVAFGGVYHFYERRYSTVDGHNTGRREATIQVSE